MRRKDTDFVKHSLSILSQVTHQLRDLESAPLSRIKASLYVASQDQPLATFRLLELLELLGDMISNVEEAKRWNNTLSIIDANQIVEGTDWSAAKFVKLELL